MSPAPPETANATLFDGGRSPAHHQIITAPGVAPVFDCASEIARHIAWLCAHWRASGLRKLVPGNIKARQRMTAQCAVAGARAGLVMGTDHAAESLMGFFTKFGDGAADVLPLAGLNKRRVRALAQMLGAPQRFVDKTPTAGLESLRPLRPDEDAYGMSYDAIDDFLEGKPASDAARATILRF